MMQRCDDILGRNTTSIFSSWISIVYKEEGRFIFGGVECSEPASWSLPPPPVTNTHDSLFAPVIYFHEWFVHLLGGMAGKLLLETWRKKYIIYICMYVTCHFLLTRLYCFSQKELFSGKEREKERVNNNTTKYPKREKRRKSENAKRTWVFFSEKINEEKR